MTLPARLAEFHANFVAGGPPWNAPAFVYPTLHWATDELGASGAAAKAPEAALLALTERGAKLVAISLETAPNGRRPGATLPW
jgi:hypothetical protein